MYSSIKNKVYLLLDPDAPRTPAYRIINHFIVFLILLNALAVILETVDSFYFRYTGVFHVIELITVVIFSAEYLFRMWACTSNPKYRHPFWGRLRYAITIGALIDLMAIIPIYLPLVLRYDLRFLRLLRLFRFLKIGRYVKASGVIVRVMIAKKEELLISLGIIFFLIISSSSIMYYIEHDAQPEQFSSIPEIMWWSIGTLTTVGYSDVHAITPLGKTLTSIISILGIGMFALPAGILASGFSDEIRKSHNELNTCPYCGQDILHDHS